MLYKTLQYGWFSIVLLTLTHIRWNIPNYINPKLLQLQDISGTSPDECTITI